MFMLNLYVIQAEEGDCLILEHGTPQCPRFLLIDGGPDTIYDAHLRPVLQGIREAGHNLELVVLSHVDDDHVNGLLDMVAELQQQRDSGVPETMPVGELWHNTFSQTVGGDVETRFRSLVEGAVVARSVAGRSARAGRSIRQGDELTRFAVGLQIPINPGFPPQHLICLDDQPDPLRLGDLTLRVVGPTRSNLERLRRKWLKWLEQNEKPILSRDPNEAAAAVRKADNSVPNLSSIMLLAEADGTKVLLTGDGRGDHLLDGLAQAGLLDPEGRLHVDVLKVPHHGSSRNANRVFFQTVTADTYVVSANGKHDNPDLAVLRWIVETAREDERPITVYATNATDSTRQLQEERDPEEFGYRLITMARGDHAMVLELSPTHGC
jgi:beta-lactamase superfamily II metal-dependent hydrolase